MIKLLHLLLENYKYDKKLFFSWDAASWHASKALYDEVTLVNSKSYRFKNSTPEVILAPLPSRVQFLNVIESVFSGMARAIIHNSNYSYVSECKEAINKYLDTRNPHRAGNKIWGDELVVPRFNPINNCKDPNCR